MSATDRERFCAVMACGPLSRADAIILLTGDGEARIPATLELFRQGAAPGIVVTGGLNNPPHSLPASVIGAKLVGLGVAPDRVLVDNDAMHTQQQAVNVYDLCHERVWTKLLLVASPYHCYRAFLTFLKVLIDRGEDRRIQVVPVPASNTPWWGTPAGLGASRFDLLDEEFAKVELYAADVASYAQGIEYLKYWESPPKPGAAAA